jgi:hypothetical protein
MTVVVRLLSLAVGCLLLFIGVAMVSPRLVPKLAGGLRPVAKWVMFVGSLIVYPIRLGTWLVRAALFREGLGVGGHCWGGAELGGGLNAEEELGDVA